MLLGACGGDGNTTDSASGSTGAPATDTTSTPTPTTGSARGESSPPPRCGAATNTPGTSTADSTSAMPIVTISRVRSVPRMMVSDESPASCHTPNSLLLRSVHC